MTPNPPTDAIAIAIADSVTVSMAADNTGMLRVSFPSRVETLTSRGSTEEARGTSAGGKETADSGNLRSLPRGVAGAGPDQEIPDGVQRRGRGVARYDRRDPAEVPGAQRGGARGPAGQPHRPGRALEHARGSHVATRPGGRT